MIDPGGQRLLPYTLQQNSVYPLQHVEPHWQRTPLHRQIAA
jgi:hypothetical protein